MNDFELTVPDLYSEIGDGNIKGALWPFKHLNSNQP